MENIKLIRSGFTGNYIMPSKTMLPKLQAALARIPNIHNLLVVVNGAGRWRSVYIYTGPETSDVPTLYQFWSTTLDGTPTEAWQSIVDQIQSQF